MSQNLAFIRSFLFFLPCVGFWHIAAVAQEPPKRVLDTKGYVVPVSQVTISPKVAGQIVELAFEEGQQVKAGQVLARLDRAEFENTLRLAKAKLRLADARLAKALTNAIKADVAVAQAQVEVARVELESAELRLQSTEIRAPISGTVLAKHSEAGNLVSPVGNQLGAKICDLADLRQLDVEVYVAERDLHKVSKGMPCEIRLEAYPETAYRGRVGRVGPVADRAKGAVAVRVRINVPGGDDHLRPELGAVVAFFAKE